ncbi:MAG: restriction endonuclease subunit S [Paracoccaceae bacterium]|nr:restriction endonuclease subunit S [Paracoccaceae bacterium]
MKAGWRTATVGEICTLATGGTPSKTKPEYFKDGEIKWLVSGDVHNKEIFDCNGRISQLGYDNSNARFLPVNSVIIALNGQGKTRGTVAVLRTVATCNQSLVSISPRDLQTLLPEYLYYNLHGRYDEIRRMTGDAGNERRGLNMPLIRSISLPLPPLDEQKRIVALLDEAFEGLDRARANAEANLADARGYLRAFAQEQLNLSDAENAALGDTCEIYQPQTISKKEMSPDGEFVVYGANGPIGRYHQFNHEQPQLLVTCRGATCGNVNISEPFSWITGNAMVVRPKTRALIVQYLEAYFRYVMDFRSVITGSAQPQITRTSLSPVRVPIPEISVQHELIELISDVEAKTQALQDAYTQSLADLDALRQSLLQKAFSGELT